MDILERLEKIERLERDEAPAGVLLEEVRALLAEAEVWVRPRLARTNGRRRPSGRSARRSNGAKEPLWQRKGLW